MKITAFEKNELKSQGSYPTVGTWYGDPQFPVEKFTTPISPRENYRNFLEHKKCAWIPSTTYDVNIVYPDIVPDNIACGYGGGIDSFGTRWIPNQNPWIPAFVDPSFELLEDIANWKKLTFPDPDAWDWETNGKLYRDTLDKDRMNWGIMLSGCWERLIDVMPFEEAAMALLTDPDEVHAFLEKVLEYNLKIIENLNKYYQCDIVLVHDDWGSQMAPFFSKEVVEEFFAPMLKAQVQKAHELGMKYVHHSCGNITDLVSVMVECKVDMWQFNYEAVKDTILDTIRKYGTKICFDGTFGFVETLPENNQEFLKKVREIYDMFGKTGCCTISLYEIRERPFDLHEVCYQYARETAYRIYQD